MSDSGLKHLATTLHRQVNELPWVPVGTGASIRLVQASIAEDISVTYLRAEPRWSSALHCHRGMTFGYTIAGAWDHSVDASSCVPGTYVYEPKDELHRFINGPEPTEAIFVTIGPVDYYDESGQFARREGAASKLRSYYEACESAGIPRPNVMTERCVGRGDQAR
jgi:hypothetical protein